MDFKIFHLTGAKHLELFDWNQLEKLREVFLHNFPVEHIEPKSKIKKLWQKTVAKKVKILNGIV